MILRSKVKAGYQVDLLLCHDDGTPLPLQQKCVLEQDLYKGQKVTVTFAIDGERLRIEPSDSEPLVE